MLTRVLGLGSCLVMSAVLLTTTGCPIAVPPEAVLAGDWEGTLDDGTEIELHFNDIGVLTRIVATNDEGTATLTLSDSVSNVDGSDVTITVTTASGEVVFEGTLSEDENTLSGSLSRSLDVGTTIIITVPQGELTFTRIGGDDNENDNVDDNTNDNVDDNANDNAGGNDNVDDNTNDNTGTNGDPVNGEAVYSANCQACHSADATGGIGPNIQGATQAEVENALANIGIHASITLTDTEIADVSAYLGTLP